MKHLIALLLSMFSVMASAADFTAASCSYADVNSAYTSASDGDRVLIPSCSSTDWAGNVLTVTKGIQIIGAGVSSTTLANGRFTLNVPDGKSVRVSGFKLTGTAGFNIIGHSKAQRIDNINFESVLGFTENRHIWISPATGGYSTGLIDHITVTDPGGTSGSAIQIHHRENWGNGNASYMRPLDLGGPDAWYVEDSDFSQPVGDYQVSAPITDCDGGGRLVFRYNTVARNYFEMHDAIISGIRSCRKWEIYENTWTASDPSQYVLIALRGGTGVVFNNTFQQESQTGADFNIIFSNYRSGGQTAGDPWTSTCQLSGSTKACLNVTSTTPAICTTDANCGGVSGSCVKIDGSGGSGLPTNYPCRDQLGTIGNAPQRIHPALFWNNKNGSNAQRPPTQQAFSTSTYLVEGRDYCIGPTISTSDDATQPTSCGGISTPYTPYTYPHPLQSALQAPKPPTSGSVN